LDPEKIFVWKSISDAMYPTIHLGLTRVN